MKKIELTEPCIAGKGPIRQIVEPGIYDICKCGLSSNQPYCDGSHKGTDFKPFVVKIEERKKVSWCACKRSNKEAFCDGTHKSLNV